MRLGGARVNRNLTARQRELGHGDDFPKTLTFGRIGSLFDEAFWRKFARRKLRPPSTCSPERTHLDVARCCAMAAKTLPRLIRQSRTLPSERWGGRMFTPSFRWSVFPRGGAAPVSRPIPPAPRPANPRYVPGFLRPCRTSQSATFGTSLRQRVLNAEAASGGIHLSTLAVA